MLSIHGHRSRESLLVTQIVTWSLFIALQPASGFNVGISPSLQWAGSLNRNDLVHGGVRVRMALSDEQPAWGFFEPLRPQASRLGRNPKDRGTRLRGENSELKGNLVTTSNKGSRVRSYDYELEQKGSGVRVGSYTISGYSAPGKPKSNQDVMASVDGLGADKSTILLVGVDGHGSDGAAVAKRVALSLSSSIQGNTDAASLRHESTLQNGLSAAYQAADSELQKMKIGSESGATATVLLLNPRERKLGLGWVGDSRAIVGGSGMLGGTVSFDRLTTDHKPSSAAEKWRIFQAGGEVRTLRSRAGLRDYVFYRGQNVPGLAVSRSLGDWIGKRLGQSVISGNPDVKLRQLSPSHQVAIVASDGLWDMVRESEAMNFAVKELRRNPAADPAEVASQLALMARKRWADCSDSSDDISVLIAFL